MNSIKQIFVNLPIRDIAKTREFWTKLGFGFNEKFSDDKALCLILNNGSIYAMLLTREFFGSFTNRPVADGTATEVLLSIDVGSRAKVDELVRLALENGGTRYKEPEDYGWMYQDRFTDPDGHQWEVAFMDLSLMPNE